MTVRELLHGLVDHAADGRRLDDEILIQVGTETRSVSASYANGTFILIAGAPVEHS